MNTGAVLSSTGSGCPERCKLKNERPKKQPESQFAHDQVPELEPQNRASPLGMIERDTDPGATDVPFLGDLPACAAPEEKQHGAHQTCNLPGDGELPGVEPNLSDERSDLHASGSKVTGCPDAASGSTKIQASRNHVASGLVIDFGDAVQRTGHNLASMSGVDLQSAGPATVRAWEARGLALHQLAAGNMAEALKVMEAARPADRRSSTPATNQPRTAAKETR
ncbi:hypothetical protein [Stenotrophomonas sp. 364]|uniref:hypothetical protein n=1 Tax=Stenotrophomonas sp. 364 TaxID=2691571 RepID=UPI001315FBE7|nr:hypothetical protein [Stenotrophomonas sp. 364]QHB72045.1 hypothetical protein GQ674_12410 [Stenotrophomonas sp. 364]